MKTSKQYQITLENGDKCIITDADLKHRSRLYYTDVGPGFRMEAVVEITLLPNERIINNGRQMTASIQTGRINGYLQERLVKD